jgi:hypothetical protein
MGNPSVQCALAHAGDSLGTSLHVSNGFATRPRPIFSASVLIHGPLQTMQGLTKA